MDLNINPQEVELREQDRWLPIANVARLMKGTLPPSAKVSKDAKECMQECVSELISFITSEASDKCLREKRKTINGEDVLYSMYDLGFENYAEILKIYLAKYREQQALRQERGDGKPSRRYPKKTDMPSSQLALTTDMGSTIEDGDGDGDDSSSERQSSAIIEKKQEVDEEDDGYDDPDVDASAPSDKEHDFSEQNMGPDAKEGPKVPAGPLSEYDSGIDELSGGESRHGGPKNGTSNNFGIEESLEIPSELNKEQHLNPYGYGQFLTNPETNSVKRSDEEAGLDPQSNGYSRSLAPGGDYEHEIGSLAGEHHGPYF